MMVCHWVQDTSQSWGWTTQRPQKPVVTLQIHPDYSMAKLPGHEVAISAGRLHGACEWSSPATRQPDRATPAFTRDKHSSQSGDNPQPQAAAAGEAEAGMLGRHAGGWRVGPWQQTSSKQACGAGSLAASASAAQCSQAVEPDLGLEGAPG